MHTALEYCLLRLLGADEPRPMYFTVLARSHRLEQSQCQIASASLYFEVLCTS